MKILKIILTKVKYVAIIALIIETILLGVETNSYLTNKYSHRTINGEVVAEVDNIINFSGMAR